MMWNPKREQNKLTADEIASWKEMQLDWVIKQGSFVPFVTI